MPRRNRSMELAHLVQSYFVDHLGRVRGASPHTIRSYGTTCRLFLIFLAERLGKSVDRLDLEDISAENVLAFLAYLETGRGNRVSTRNGRLASIHSLVGFLLRHDPAHSEQYQRILSVPSKRAEVSSIRYLEPEEVRAILEVARQEPRRGKRDFALLLFLYNSGARISEALDLRMEDLHLDRPCRARLHGKGKKERVCPLWRYTAAALKRLMVSQGTGKGDHLFLNGRGQPLGRDGAAYLLRKHVSLAAEETPSLTGKKVTPHVLRHSCAVGLLQAGVDITVIRDILGHASITTTNRYIATNLEMKREALESFWKGSGLLPKRPSPLRPDSDLLAFLTAI